MNSLQTKSVVSNNAVDTEALAESIGRRCKGGEVIELISDIGGGKTTFVRGLARGLGSTDHVSSPTFKISNVYHGSDLVLYHFDFYRLHEPGLASNELSEVINESLNVVVVEWSDIVAEVLPAQRLSVYISVAGEQSRKLEFKCPASLEYLIASKEKKP